MTFCVAASEVTDIPEVDWVLRQGDSDRDLVSAKVTTALLYLPLIRNKTTRRKLNSDFLTIDVKAGEINTISLRHIFYLHLAAKHLINHNNQIIPGA